MALLIVLFSCGLFFQMNNSLMKRNNNIEPTTYHTRTLKSVDDTNFSTEKRNIINNNNSVCISGDSSISKSSYKTVSYREVMKNLNNNKKEIEEKLEKSESLNTPSTNFDNNDKNEDTDVNMNRIVEESASVNNVNTQKIVIQSDPLHEGNGTPVHIELFSNESTNQASNLSANTVPIDSNLLSRLISDEYFQYKKNTAYVTVSNMVQLKPTQSEPFEPDAPLYISFILPTSVLPRSTSTLPVNEGLNDNMIVEINCNVVEVNISPFEIGQFNNDVVQVI